jgi:hypothetical protein
VVWFSERREAYMIGSLQEAGRMRQDSAAVDRLPDGCYVHRPLKTGPPEGAGVCDA